MQHLLAHVPRVADPRPVQNPLKHPDAVARHVALPLGEDLGPEAQAKAPRPEVPWDLLPRVAGEEGEHGRDGRVQDRPKVRHEERQDREQSGGDLVVIGARRAARVPRLPVQADALDPRRDEGRVRLDHEAGHRVAREVRVERAVEGEVCHADGGAEQEVVPLQVGGQEVEQSVELLQESRRGGRRDAQPRAKGGESLGFLTIVRNNIRWIAWSRTFCPMASFS
jgi:hypothetical protein